MGQNIEEPAKRKSQRQSGLQAGVCGLGVVQWLKLLLQAAVAVCVCAARGRLFPRRGAACEKALSP